MVSTEGPCEAAGGDPDHAHVLMRDPVATGEPASGAESGSPGWFGLVEDCEQIGLGLLHRLSCGQVSLGAGLGLRIVQRDPHHEAPTPSR